MGDYIFGWQPKQDEWYFLQVAYQSGTQDGGQQLCGAWGCTPGSIFLSVDNRAAGDISSLGASCLQSQSSPDGGVTCTQPGRAGNLAVGGLNEDGTPVDGGKDCPCEINGPPVHLNSPRLGAWDYDADGVMDRSMRGQIAVFRLWDNSKIVMLSRFVALSVSLIQKVSLLQSRTARTAASRCRTTTWSCSTSSTPSTTC